MRLRCLQHHLQQTDVTTHDDAVRHTQSTEISVTIRHTRHLLVVPRFQIDTYGRRTFAVARPTTWNLFQNNLREPDMQIDCFRRTLKTFLFDQYSAH